MPKQKNQKESSEPQEQEKKKKVKVIYYDDGSTVADMSGTCGKRTERKKSTFKEKMQTFFGVMKIMFIPMLCTLTAFTLVYLFLVFATGSAS